MSSIVFFLIFVKVWLIGEVFCDSRISAVFEEDELGEEGRGCFLDYLIFYFKFIG